ncbi:Trehalose utilisation [Chitinophaga costaii]|uniref:Trehalose utilisation n=1 Tax=Chitinophaga costaii TaxID=1335309 RepID=A0A1C4BL72_9BACT|nr:ThuA domain-containing protein [Chitinophaga costaii]PUZ27562.1 ThuA domain-containing protein [Chitinophaga costaii]SCC07659.1 Trehalose utilisation [Chitinophaga costaii]
MIKRGGCLILLLLLVQLAFGQQPAFKAIAFYSTTVEGDHVDFAHDIIPFYQKLAKEKGFVFDTTSDWSKTNDEVLKQYQVVVWINEFVQNEPQRRAFERFINRGGAWLGFHVAAYNDKYTQWPWYVQFLGGGVFYSNNWPPLRAKMIVDDNTHPVTQGMPKAYTAPINEWYQWRPSPRANKLVKVLVTLDPSNYPIGKKDIMRQGDIPVVWTNTQYKMVYFNMGHGDQVLTDSLQNNMFTNALLWLGGAKK